MSAKIRINQYLAAAGLGSRRKCESLVLSGSVSINGVKIDSLSTNVDPEIDNVAVNGKEVNYINNKTVLVLNKPQGVLSSASDDRGRKTVIDMAKEMGYTERLYPVGRLDIDTTGVILLTDDGQLAYRLTHPKHEIPKKYRARVEGKLTAEEADKITRGVDIGGYITRKCDLNIIRVTNKYTDVEITIREGKKRQVKRMFGSVGHRVTRLDRNSIGGLSFNKLKVGKIRPLSKNEEELLRNNAGLDKKGK